MRPRHFIPALALVLLVAYPLSWGPVLRHHIMTQNHAETHMIVTIYRPVLWLCGTCPPFKVAFDAYMNLWRPKKKRAPDQQI